MAWPEALSQMPLKLQPNSAIQIYYYYYSFGGMMMMMNEFTLMWRKS